MSETTDTPPSSSNDDNPSRRRRRRRRRRRDGGPEAAASGGGERPRRRGRRSRGGSGDGGEPGVEMPNVGRKPRRRRTRRRRKAPVSGVARRRQLTRAQIEELEEYFSKVDHSLLQNMYRGLGGQPDRVGEPERIVQLCVRALSQSKRIASMLRSMHERERTALAILIQCGGLAHSEEFLTELSLSLGGQSREWQKVMVTLANKGLIFASEERDKQFFYLVPDPMVEFLVEGLSAEMSVPNFAHPEIAVREQSPVCPPRDFSVPPLCTYMDQRPPRLTQQQEIFKVHKEEMDTFFAQVWEGGSDLFHFHVDFLMLHGLVELHGDTVSVNREVVEEWLNLDSQDQRDLIFRSLDRTFPYAEWVLWAVHSGKGEWVPERPLSALYRRWNRGEDWRARLHKGAYAATRQNERESWSFAPLVNCGMLELGEWGQEKFYRLTPRALAMLEPSEDEGFTAFYLTPSFEIMAPAGLAPVLLFRIGEIAELTGCDRANTYKITELSVEQALAKGWRRDDLLDFLRENAQTGLPENVDQTLRGWMGHHGDVEFHQAVLMTVHKSRIRKLESARALRPFLLHRYAPGLYAVDPRKLDEMKQTLEEVGFHPSDELTHLPGRPDQLDARDRLLQLVAEAREASQDPLARAQAADTVPRISTLCPVPVVPGAQRARKNSPPACPPKKPACSSTEASPPETVWRCSTCRKTASESPALSRRNDWP